MITIIKEAARVYKSVIPEDRWHDPYIPLEELEGEIEDGVEFWGMESHGELMGVMGIHDKGEVTLIHHAYVMPNAQKKGIGTKLLRHLEGLARKPILIGTWAAAGWAIDFYRKNGYTLLPEGEKNRLLRRYWKIPERQAETSVVMAGTRR